MKNITKKYKFNNSNINVTINYGFDKELILNHPSTFENEPHILYIFLSSDEMEENINWLWENKENNSFVVIMITKYEEDKFDKIISSIDTLYSSVKEKFNNLKNDN